MKNVKYIVTIVLGLALSSCGDSFLTQYPEGGVLLQDQFAKLPDNLKGSILGIYSKMYEYGGDHDSFGLRAIDMYGDIQSGDMAMKKSSYGWFESYERGYFYAYARSYIWSFYYDIINLANLGLMAVEANSSKIMEDMAAGKSTEEAIQLQGYYYGQLLALRGWAYDNLLKFYCDPMDELDDLMDNEPAIPVYTETEVAAGTLGEPLSTVTEVYERIYEDLSTAIDLLDFYSQYNARGSKLEVNADVARIFLAYSMLNHGNTEGTIIADGKNAWQIAFEQAKAVIDGGKYPLLPQAELTTTGFGDVTAKNWMWGQDVTVETTTALASFFGQVDIHTYSYAAAGDTKGIDANLYAALSGSGWDARVNWFRSPEKTFAYCPDGKFYNISTKDVTALSKVDRDWLNDNVFMRVEVAYLIAAEAAYNLNDNTNAEKYLRDLCSERLLDGKTIADFDAWLATTGVKEALAYNWRIEMWGEGYGLQTLRRLTKAVKLGENHLDRKNADIKADAQYQCEIPTSETRYNPHLATNQLTKNNNK